MKKLIITLLFCSICSFSFAADKVVSITLNDDQQDAWENMLSVDTANLQAAMQEWITGKAQTHIIQRLQEELDKLTVEEVKNLMPNFKIKKGSTPE